MFLMVQIIQTSLGCWFNIKVSTSSVKNGVRENDGMVAVHRKKKKKKKQASKHKHLEKIKNFYKYS